MTLLSSWTDYPAHIEIQQRAWERNIVIWRAVNAGATYAEIALKLNRSTNWVGERYRKIDRYIRRGFKCPAERYITDQDEKTWDVFSDNIKRQIRFHKLMRINNHV